MFATTLQSQNNQPGNGSEMNFDGGFRAFLEQMGEEAWGERVKLDPLKEVLVASNGPFGLKPFVFSLRL